MLAAVFYEEIELLPCDIVEVSLNYKKQNTRVAVKNFGKDVFI